MTMQIPDILVWRGVKHSLVTGLLDFKSLFPEVVFPKLERISSACWRGYVETWMIDDEDMLRIAGIVYFADIDDGGTANQLYNLLPNYDNSIAVLRFSGEGIAGYSDVSPFGMQSCSYSNYRVFHFERGLLKKVDEHDRAWFDKDRVPYELPNFLK